MSELSFRSTALVKPLAIIFVLINHGICNSMQYTYINHRGYRLLTNQMQEMEEDDKIINGILGGKVSSINIIEGKRSRRSTPSKTPSKNVYPPKAYKQPITKTFEFFGPYGVIACLLGLPTTVILLFQLCTQEFCPPAFTSVPAFLNYLQRSKYFDLEAFSLYVAWVCFHVVLAIIAPGPTVSGSVLPDGKKLSYKINGFSSLVASLFLLGGLSYKYGLAPLLWIAQHYLQLSVAGIIFATALSIFLYLSSFHSEKVIVAAGGNSGYWVYDFWMGRELNPRMVYGLVDLKFVCELRPGAHFT